MSYLPQGSGQKEESGTPHKDLGAVAAGKKRRPFGGLGDHLTKKNIPRGLTRCGAQPKTTKHSQKNHQLSELKGP